MDSLAQSSLRIGGNVGSEQWGSVMRYSVKLLTAGVLVVSAGGFSTGAQATEVCYRLDPFIDILRLELDPVKHGHRNVYGNWIAPGVYTLPVSGAYELDLDSKTVRRLGIVGTNATEFFGDNLLCGLDGIRGRNFELNCSGGPGDDFQNNGTLTPISCTEVPRSVAPGQAAGVK
jgi:hypothetical protein